jgi:hypothetical protein
MHTLVRSVALSWALLLSMTACGVGTDGLRAKAAADIGCDAQALSIHGTGMTYVERVSGCGKENVYFYQRGEHQWTSPVDRATFEMSCPKSDLLTTPIDAKTVGVSGCGKKAVYNAVFDLSGGKWVLNSLDSGANERPAGPNDPPR